MSLLLTVVLAGCNYSSSNPTPIPAEYVPLPTPASTLPELIRNLSSDSMAVRLVSIYELEKYGDEATQAIPTLIKNLYVDDYQVRMAANIALGHLGPKAKSAVPDLVLVLHNDPFIHVKVEAADALGLIEDRSVVQELAIALFSEDAYAYDGLAIECSKSIAKLTGEKFTDFDF